MILRWCWCCSGSVKRHTRTIIYGLHVQISFIHTHNTFEYDCIRLRIHRDKHTPTHAYTHATLTWCRVLFLAIWSIHAHLYGSLIVRLFCFVSYKSRFQLVVVLLFLRLRLRSCASCLTHTPMPALRWCYKIDHLHYKYFVKVYSHIIWLLRWCIIHLDFDPQFIRNEFYRSLFEMKELKIRNTVALIFFLFIIRILQSKNGFWALVAKYRDFSINRVIYEAAMCLHWRMSFDTNYTQRSPGVQ